MRELKFRYVLRSRADGKISYKWRTLCQIEYGLENLFKIDNYKIISRDQYTGLKDVNDKKICEGDILRCTSQSPEAKDKMFNAEVYFCVGTATCEYKVKNGRWHKGLSSNKIYNWEAEIIGNIYENPELLEESN